jgi:hypothetical protein
MHGRQRASSAAAPLPPEPARHAPGPSADPSDPHGDWEQIWTISRQCKGKPHFLKAMEEFYSR